MTMTKRDVADIVLVWMAVSLFMSLLTSIMTLGAWVGMTDLSKQYEEKSVGVTFQILQIVALLFLNYVLLFKRSFLLSRVFPDGKAKEVSVPEGLSVLISYAFWIRLLGIFTFLSSGIKFIGRLGMDVAAQWQFLAPRFWMHNSGAELASAVLAAIVIWKADWIAEKLGRLGSSKCDGANAASPRR